MVVVVYLDGDDGLCGPVVEVTVVEGEMIGDPGLSSAVHKIVLQQPKSDRFHVVDACEDLDAIH